MPIEMDRWGVDYYCTGSQKALALPPGLALGAASERFLERAERQDDAGTFLSVRKLARIARESLPTWTPAMSLILALECQLSRIARDGGWPARWERHCRMQKGLESWVSARSDVGFMAPAGARSPAVSALTLPPGKRPAAVIEALEARGFLVGGRLVPRHDPIIRIGHMGDLGLPHLEALLAELAEILA
jgi:aspartate aminotransferase-like enzyme